MQHSIRKHPELKKGPFSRKASTLSLQQIIKSPKNDKTPKSSDKFFLTETARDTIGEEESLNEISSVQFYKAELFTSLGIPLDINEVNLKHKVKPIKSKRVEDRNTQDLTINQARLINLRHLSNMKS